MVNDEDEVIIEFAVNNFVSLETRLSDCMDYIPFIKHNMKILSPKFIPILLEACSLIESIFFVLSENKQNGTILKSMQKN